MINERHKYQNGFKIPVIAIIFIIISIFLAAIYFKGASELATKKNNYTEVEAKVIDHTYRNGRPISAVLQYTVDDGIYQTVSNSSINSSKTNGAIVKIKYNPNKPTDIVYVDEHENILIIVSSIVLFAIGITIVIISFVKLAKQKERKGTVLEGVPVYHSNVDDNKKRIIKKDNLADRNNNSTIVAKKMGLNDALSKTHNEISNFDNQNFNNINSNTQNVMANTYNESQMNAQSDTINNSINNQNNASNSIIENTSIQSETQEQISAINNYDTQMTTNSNYAETQPISLNSNIIANTQTVSGNSDDKLNELEIDSNLSDNEIIDMINIINNNNVNTSSHINTQDNSIINVPNTDRQQPVIKENVIPEPISETQRLRSKLEILKHKNGINTDSYTTPDFMSKGNEDNV